MGKDVKCKLSVRRPGVCEWNDKLQVCCERIQERGARVNMLMANCNIRKFMSDFDTFLSLVSHHLSVLSVVKAYKWHKHVSPTHSAEQCISWYAWPDQIIHHTFITSCVFRVSYLSNDYVYSRETPSILDFISLSAFYPVGCTEEHFQNTTVRVCINVATHNDPHLSASAMDSSKTVAAPFVTEYTLCSKFLTCTTRPS